MIRIGCLCHFCLQWVMKRRTNTSFGMEIIQFFYNLYPILSFIFIPNFIALSRFFINLRLHWAAYYRKPFYNSMAISWMSVSVPKMEEAPTPEVQPWYPSDWSIQVNSKEEEEEKKTKIPTNIEILFLLSYTLIQDAISAPDCGIGMMAGAVPSYGEPRSCGIDDVWAPTRISAFHQPGIDL